MTSFTLILSIVPPPDSISIFPEPIIDSPLTVLKSDLVATSFPLYVNLASGKFLYEISTDIPSSPATVSTFPRFSNEALCSINVN
jgi:hypothetical protein